MTLVASLILLALLIFLCVFVYYILSILLKGKLVQYTRRGMSKSLLRLALIFLSILLVLIILYLHYAITGKGILEYFSGF